MWRNPSCSSSARDEGVPRRSNAGPVGDELRDLLFGSLAVAGDQDLELLPGAATPSAAEARELHAKYRTAVGEEAENRTEEGTRRLVVFDEEIVLDPPLVELLVEIEGRLESLAARYGPTVPPGKRFELLDSALDELDSALERVRDARSKLARIELRLVAAYERALEGLREVERDAEPRKD